MVKHKSIFLTKGPEAGAALYRKMLMKLRPKLVRLTANTTIIFKLVDHLWVCLNTDLIDALRWTGVTVEVMIRNCNNSLNTLSLCQQRTMHTLEPRYGLNDGWNYALYNQMAVEVLTGSGVIIWNSTLPLSYLYAVHCFRNQKLYTPLTLYWNCPDEGHVGYIIENQYTNMIMNHYCNRALKLGDEYCG